VTLTFGRCRGNQSDNKVCFDFDFEHLSDFCKFVRVCFDFQFHFGLSSAIKTTTTFEEKSECNNLFVSRILFGFDFQFRVVINNQNNKNKVCFDYDFHFGSSSAIKTTTEESESEFNEWSCQEFDWDLEKICKTFASLADFCNLVASRILFRHQRLKQQQRDEFVLILTLQN
jgi:hypothetical protein